MLHNIFISSTKNVVLSTALVVYIRCQASVRSDEYLPEDEKERK